MSFLKWPPVAAFALASVCLAQPAQAISVTLDEAPGRASSYEEGGLRFSGLRTAAGNCPGGDARCLLLQNTKKGSTLVESASGGAFDLESFDFLFTGKAGASFRLVADGDVIGTFTQGEDYAKKTAYTYVANLSGVMSLLFERVNNAGTVRIDNIEASLSAGQTSPVPLPAAAWLLLGGMGGLLALGRSRRA